MKHFKLNIEQKSVPVADICIAQVPEKDYEAVAKAFIHALIESSIAFDYVERTNTMLIAKKKELSFSISE